MTRVEKHEVVAHRRATLQPESVPRGLSNGEVLSRNINQIDEKIV